jgi:hypothetical protein
MCEWCIRLMMEAKLSGGLWFDFAKLNLAFSEDERGIFPQVAHARITWRLTGWRRCGQVGMVFAQEFPEGFRGDGSVWGFLTQVAYMPLRNLADTQIEDTTFEWYRPQSIRFADAMAHPTPLMESVALGSILPPVPSYQPVLPAYLVTEGILSESQLEAITLAGEAHSRLIEIMENVPGEEAPQRVTVRQGFMLGDGAGSGKGRTTAGLILDRFYKGDKRALWVSENDRLYNDAIRDYLDIGGDPKKCLKLGRYKPADPITLEEGVIFCTYAMLRSRIKKVDPNTGAVSFPTTRLDQIIAWLGDETFSGPIVFDESQNLQNAMDTADSGNWGIKKPSQQAIASLEIQRRLPLARVMYSSATSGDHLEALAYAPRLGLWGSATAFPDRKAFLASMEEGGVTALEMICRDLKAMGVYCSRQLSNKGVTSEVLMHELSPEQIVQMQSFNKAWRLISTGMEQALVMTGAAESSGKNRLALSLKGAGNHVGLTRSKLESAKQRFYMLALISMRIPTIIEHVKEKLAAGESCVLQIHNTQEASLNRALEELEDEPELTLEELDLSPRRELIDFVKECFPVGQKQLDGKVLVDVIDHVTGLPLENHKAIELRENILKDLEGLMIPKAPIDILMDAFGPDAVAEVTGRSNRVVMRPNAQGHLERVVERRSKKDNAREIEAFMNGPKRILIFSESAGGVGASYHASRACSNQSRRNHYLVQVPWRSIDAVQGMGRTNRTNQVSFPHYVLTTTNVPAELRFISTIARRLDQLGSLTRGQRDATSTNDVFSSDDNLETKYGEAALREMMRLFDQDTFPGMTRDQLFLQTGIDAKAVVRSYSSNTAHQGQRVNIPRFLNRLLGVDIDANGGFQQILLSDLRGRMEDIKSQAMADGTYDAGLQTLAPLSLKKISDVLLRTDPQTGAHTRLAELEMTEKLTPLTFDEAADKLRFFEAFSNDLISGWRINPHTGELALHIPVRHLMYSSGPSTNEVRLITPYGEVNRERHDGVRYVRISPEAARAQWDHLIATGPTTKTSTFHVVYGTLLPIWANFTNSMPQIWRMQTDDGEKILGRRLPKHEVKGFKTTFGVAA